MNNNIIKKIKEITIIFLFMILTANIFAEARKQMVAVPYFKVEGRLSRAYARTLANTMIVGLESSGRIETKGNDDIKTMLKELDTIQSFGECSASNACSKRLGRKMQVSYIAKNNIARVGRKYVITVRMIPILADLEIPTIQRTVYSERQIIPTVKKMARLIALSFPLKGGILALIGKKYVIIDLGQSHNIGKKDEFIVIRENPIRNSEGEVVYTDKKKIGELEVLNVRSKSAKCEISDSDEQFKEGDIVVLKQDNTLKRLQEESERTEEKKKSYISKTQKKGKRYYSLNRYHDFIRFGYSGGSFQTSDYAYGEKYFLDLAFGNKYAFYLRMFYFINASTITKSVEVESEDTSTYDTLYLKDASTIGMGGGYRFQLTSTYFLYQLWELYVNASIRFYNVTDDSQLDAVSTWGAGYTLGLSLEATILKKLSVFLEYNYVASEIGDTVTVDLGGHEFYAGVILRRI